MGQNRNSDNSHGILIPAFGLALMVVLLIGLGAIIGRAVSSDSHQSTLIAQMAGLEHEQTQLNAKQAEAEATLALRNAQIETMQQDLESKQQRMQTMQQRLDMFDEVLAQRKVRGVHVLHPSAHWQDDGSIQYQLVLVKGENYPRWIKGRLIFTATNASGESVTLQDHKGRESKKLEMTTHAFIEGQLLWQQAWKPDAISVALIDERGRQKAAVSIPVNGHGAKETAP